MPGLLSTRTGSSTSVSIDSLDGMRLPATGADRGGRLQNPVLLVQYVEKSRVSIRSAP